MLLIENKLGIMHYELDLSFYIPRHYCLAAHQLDEFSSHYLYAILIWVRRRSKRRQVKVVEHKKSLQLVRQLEVALHPH